MWEIVEMETSTQSESKMVDDGVVTTERKLESYFKV